MKKEDDEHEKMASKVNCNFHRSNLFTCRRDDWSFSGIPVKITTDSSSRNKKHILDGKEKDILKLINKGLPKKQIAKLMRVSIFTLFQFLKMESLLRNPKYIS